MNNVFFLVASKIMINVAEAVVVVGDVVSSGLVALLQDGHEPGQLPPAARGETRVETRDTCRQCPLTKWSLHDKAAALLRLVTG